MRLWSHARYALGLTSRQFYNLTPRQFDALLQCHRDEVESREVLFGQLTSWVANTGFRSTKEPTKTKDFMPSQWSKLAAAAAPKNTEVLAKRRRSRKVIAAEARGIAEALRLRGMVG